ncbi:MAG: sodium/proton-translocating pyrophosphatase, partial [Bacteroidales bacterium]|nr:sodium/proton-translocating pyrophosphatase [Bacteroidales bacterium]
MNPLFYAVPCASIGALLFAFFFYRQMKKQDEGTPTMKQIAQYVREGAMAYLKQQYKVVVIVFVIMAVFFAVLAYVFKVQNPWVPFAFLTGG